MMQERGLAFEQAYLKSLIEEGLTIAKPIEEDTETSFQRTCSAMQEGVDVIYQASLKSGIWRGRADFLRKVKKASGLGSWSYEVIDTKLAKETRAGTILQLCLYSQMISEIQGIMPEFMRVITPENNFSAHPYRVDDFLAYHRFVQRRLMDAIAKGTDHSYTYPNPVAHCDTCRWWQYCVRHRRTDDHLSLVAGLSNTHVTEFKKWNIETLQNLAIEPLPLSHKPAKGAIETFERLREQARVQFEARQADKPVYETLRIEEGRGFFKLPVPSQGDIFFDFESDPFAGTTGLQYLFGWVFTNDPESYQCIWALTPKEEKKAFETFVDMVMALWKQFPDLHIYHYSPFEPAALKRLMGAHATRENEIDQMLRAGIFIDLHSVTKQALRAGIETYSLKELEKFHGFERGVALRDAAQQLRTLESFIERKNTKDIPEETKTAVQTYNKEDCLSTKNLRDWLESLRDRLIQDGNSITRPALSGGAASSALTEHQQRVQTLFEKLVAEVPIDPIERNPAQQANLLLANMLDWYRREKKATWWEYFRLCDLPDAELIEEKAAIAGLEFTGQRRQDKKSFIDQYFFPLQECDIRDGDELKMGDGNSFGKVISINAISGTVEIRRSAKTADTHPTSIFKHNDVRDTEKEEAIIRIASWVADYSMNANGNIVQAEIYS